jgi:hypothetical protein
MIRDFDEEVNLSNLKIRLETATPVQKQLVNAV